MTHYMDRFDAGLLPASMRKTIAGSIVPPLVEAIHRRNLSPRLGHDLNLVAAIQHKNANRMRLFQPFNPELQDHDPSNTVVITIERDGQPVACAGTRLFWIDDTLGDAFQSLRLLYRDVPAMARPGETCVCTAPTAWSIRDCGVALTGAVFAQQGEDPDVVRAMLRLLHLWVFTHWRWSWLTGIAEKAVVRSYAHDVYGYPMAETGLAREGRWYWMLFAPRSFYRDVVVDSSYPDLETPLCLPTEAARRQAGDLSSGFRFSGAAE